MVPDSIYQSLVCHVSLKFGPFAISESDMPPEQVIDINGKPGRPAGGRSALYGEPGQ
jgi:hypothetical protein